MDAERSKHHPLQRRDVAAQLLAERGEDLLVVTGLGSTNWDATAAGDHPLTFPLWGAMGGAVTLGLGLALAQPDKRVLVMTGDGEMLMGMGSLATVAVAAPANLAIAVFDNEHYGETGMQTTHTAGPVDLAAVARSCGIPVVGTVLSQADLSAALPILRGAPGPVFYDLKVRAEDLPFVLPPKDGVHLKNRFRAALLGDGGIS